MDDNEKAEAAYAMEEAAHLVESDMEMAIIELDRLADIRRKDPVVEAKYEELRDLVSKAILADGPRFYIDSQGVKRYAYAVQPEPVEIDLKMLDYYRRQGRISQEDFEKLAPRKVDKDAYRRLASKGVLTKEMVSRSAKIGKGTAHVRFSDPYDAR